MLEAEVAILDVLLLVAIVAGCMVWRGVLAKIVDREKAMDLHAKAVTRQALIATDEAKRTVETSRRAVDDARVIRERVDVFLNDPRLRKLIEEAG